MHALGGCSTAELFNFQNGNTALHHAAYYGKDECIEPLLEAKASLNAQNKVQLEQLLYIYILIVCVRVCVCVCVW